MSYKAQPELLLWKGGKYTQNQVTNLVHPIPSVMQQLPIMSTYAPTAIFSLIEKYLD